MDLCLSGADVAATINVLLIKLKCAFVIAKLLASAKDFKELPHQVQACLGLQLHAGGTSTAFQFNEILPLKLLD